MTYVVIAYYNASSVLPVINPGEKSYIRGRIVINDASYTVFHIESCENDSIHKLDHCIYVVTEERIIAGNEGEYGPPLFTVDKTKSIETLSDDESEAFFMEPLCRSFGDVHVAVNNEALNISLPDGYERVFTPEGTFGDEFSGHGKFNANQMRNSFEHLLSLETCQAIRTWLDSVL